mgnify:CR=1 FL=1
MHLADFLNEKFQENLFTFSSTTEENINISLYATRNNVGKIHIKTTSDNIVVTITYLSNKPEEKSIELVTDIEMSIKEWFSYHSIHRIRVLQQTHPLEIKVVSFDSSIAVLDFSVRAFNCLKWGGFDTIGKVAKLSKEQLGNIHQLGHRSVLEIVDKMEELGITIS